MQTKENTKESSPAQTRENLPIEMAATAAYHLAGAMPLASFNPAGPTLYALTIYGLESPPARPGAGRPGAASIAGPAVSAAGLTEGWPPAARAAGQQIFAKQPRHRAGMVLVILLMQIGRELHGAVYRVPAAPSHAAAPIRRSAPAPSVRP